MARRPSAPPSGVSGRRSPEAGRTSGAPQSTGRRVDVRGWLGGIRLSGFAAIMLGLVVLAGFVLVPTAGTYLEQRQRVAFLESAVRVSEDEVAELQRERERWQDEAYITTQARERLYYGFPGEVVYLVVGEPDDADLAAEPEPVSAEVEESEGDGMTQLLRSLVTAGLTETAVADDAVDGGGVFQPDTSGAQ